MLRLQHGKKHRRIHRTKEASSLKVDCGTLQPKECEETDHCLWDYEGCRHRQVFPANADRHIKCNNGTHYTECFDVQQCAKDVPGPTPTKKWALVLTHSLERNLTALPLDNLKPLQALAKQLGNTDVVLIVPKAGAENTYRGQVVLDSRLTDETRAKFRDQGVKLVEVPWTVPPKMMFNPRERGRVADSTPGSVEWDYGWCGHRDFLRVHIMGLADYDAVAYYDTDMQITHNGDPSAPLRCASKGYFLAAAGGMSPFNIGFFAVQPSLAMKEAAVYFAQQNTWKHHTGWAGAGYAPAAHAYPGFECGQGFMHTMLYKDTPQVRKAWQHAGATRPKARIVDRCIWNFQTETGCAKSVSDMDCSTIMVYHKDGQKCHRTGASFGLDRGI